MKDYKVKDLILSYAAKHGGYGNTDNISEYTNIPSDTVYSLTKEIAADGFIEANPTASMKNPGNCLMISLKPEGRHFMATKSYRKIFNRDSVSNFPKTYWWIIAIATFLFGFFVDILKQRILSVQPPPYPTEQQAIQAPVHKK